MTRPNGEIIFPAAELRVARGLPIIVFASAYRPLEIIPPHLRHFPALQKPYNPEELLCVVENVINQTKA